MPESGGGSGSGGGIGSVRGPGGDLPTRSSVTVNPAACASRIWLLRRRGCTDTRAEDVRTGVPRTRGHACRGHRARWRLSNPSPSFSLLPSRRSRPAPISPQLCPAPSVHPSVRVWLCVFVCACRCPRGGRPRAPSLSPQDPGAPGAEGCFFLPFSQEFSFSLLYFPFLSPLVSGRCSDLDRDFWNNNDNTVQQKWSSYPPKEFILNISPYAPYGDPRLSLK